MSKANDLWEQFEAIQSVAIEESELLKCPFADFVEGLKVMRDCLTNRIEAAIDELEKKS